MNSVPDFNALLAVITGFVTRTRGAPARPLGAETRLLQEGYVDSFGLVELITELEGTLGLQLPSGALIPEDFETPSTLHQRLVDMAA